MNVKEFLILGSVATNTSEVVERMKKLPPPKYVGKYKVPESLNDLTIGELLSLQGMSEVKDCLFVVCRVLFGMNETEVLATSAEDVIALSAWAAKEVERISKLFMSTSVPPTDEERQAGVGDLNFGMFGILDYFALRMGITNHEEVEHVPWVRVYKCMEMDAEKIKYERRLRKVIQERSKK